MKTIYVVLDVKNARKENVLACMRGWDLQSRSYVPWESVMDKMFVKGEFEVSLHPRTMFFAAYAYKNDI